MNRDGRQHKKADYEKSSHYIWVKFTPQLRELFKITWEGRQRVLDLWGIKTQADRASLVIALEMLSPTTWESLFKERRRKGSEKESVSQIKTLEREVGPFFPLSYTMSFLSPENIDGLNCNRVHQTDSTTEFTVPLSRSWFPYLIRKALELFFASRPKYSPTFRRQISIWIICEALGSPSQVRKGTILP